MNFKERTIPDTTDIGETVVEKCSIEDTADTFREMGKGHSWIEKFCMLMNIPPPMTLKAYQNNVTKLHPAYTEDIAIANGKCIDTQTIS